MVFSQTDGVFFRNKVFVVLFVADASMQDPYDSKHKSVTLLEAIFCYA